LKKRDIIAVMSIVSPSTFSGFAILINAATRSPKVSTIRKMQLIKVPIISALYHPKVYSLEAPLIVNFKAIIDMKKPIISEARCAVSVNIATEFARYPPMH
jgi:hypothetical protein